MRADWMVEEPEDRAREGEILARLARAWLVPITPLDPGADADASFTMNGHRNLVEVKSRDLSFDPPTYPDIALAASKVHRLALAEGQAYFIVHAQRTDTLHGVRIQRILTCPQVPFRRTRPRANGRTVPADRELVYAIPLSHFFPIKEPPR